MSWYVGSLCGEDTWHVFWMPKGAKFETYRGVWKAREFDTWRSLDLFVILTFAHLCNRVILIIEWMGASIVRSSKYVGSITDVSSVCGVLCLRNIIICADTHLLCHRYRSIMSSISFPTWVRELLSYSWELDHYSSNITMTLEEISRHNILLPIDMSSFSEIASRLCNFFWSS